MKTLIDIENNKHEGNIVRMEMARWGKKRNPELTLTLSMKDKFLNIPVSNIKELR